MPRLMLVKVCFDFPRVFLASMKFTKGQTKNHPGEPGLVLIVGPIDLMERKLLTTVGQLPWILPGQPEPVPAALG